MLLHTVQLWEKITEKWLLEFRKVKIFSCQEAAHTLCALYTGWEKLEGGKKGKQLENRVCKRI